MLKTKTILLLSLVATISACGQKGPLVVDLPPLKEGEERQQSVDGQVFDSALPGETQTNGKPTIINR